MLLREQDRAELIAIFSSVDVPYEVWAYGSRVNGTAYSGSDLDLVVRSTDLSHMPRHIISRLVEQIHDSRIPILVEVRDWAVLPDTFHRAIEAQYEILFSAR